MRSVIHLAATGALLLCARAAQVFDEPLKPGKDEIQRPEFKKRDAAAEYRQNIEDSERLARLVEEMREEIRKSGPNRISASAARKAGEIEKLIKRVRDRLR